MDNNNNIDLKKSKRLRAVRFSCMTVLAAVVSSLALHVFVYPAAFVPLGLEAVVTMLYALFPSINAGYFNLLLNVPLVIYAFFKLPKRYVAYTLAFTLLSSLFLILWEKVGLPEYEIPLFTAEGAVEPITDAGRRLIAAIFAGIMLGVRTGLMLKMGASTGGVDIIAAVVQKKMPHIDIERIITFMCLFLIAASYFVYRDFECILLGILQMYISERATAFLMRSSRRAVKVEIVTKHPEGIRDDIVNNLRHSATITESKGMYSGENNAVVFTVLNLYQMADLVNVIKKYPDTFVFYSEVQGVYGNFRRYKDQIVK